MNRPDAVLRTSLRAQCLGTASALAIAAAVLIGIGSWRDAGGSTPAQAAAAIRVSSARAEAPAELVRFLVSSDQQGEDIVNNLGMDLNPSWAYSYSYAVVTDDDAAAREIRAMGVNAMELIQVGVSARVVDLRITN